MGEAEFKFVEVSADVRVSHDAVPHAVGCCRLLGWDQLADAIEKAHSDATAPPVICYVRPEGKTLAEMLGTLLFNGGAERLGQYALAWVRIKDLDRWGCNVMTDPPGKVHP
jgi:hypothetical protein